MGFFLVGGYKYGSVSYTHLDVYKRQGYIRVEIRDGKGLYAGTNAFWMDKVMAALAESE